MSLFMQQPDQLDHLDMFMHSQEGIKNKLRVIFHCSVLISLMMEEHCISIAV
jgi:hypothetical protein